MKPLDLSKPIQTRDGRPAKFLHKLKGASQYPIVCVVEEWGHECARQYTEFGLLTLSPMPEPHHGDLINVPVKHVREYWVNLHPDRANDSLHEFKDEIGGADSTLLHRIACKKITIEFKEGEGLDGFKEPDQERWDEVVKK